MSEHPSHLAERWRGRAEENVERWGNQEPKVLALALAEELAEVVDEIGDEHGALELVRVAGYNARDELEEHHENDDGEPLPREERPTLDGVADREAALEELHDLAPLVYQLKWALEERETMPDGGDEWDLTARVRFARDDEERIFESTEVVDDELATDGGDGGVSTRE